MAQAFNYRAKTVDGKIVTGVIESDTAENARRILEQNQLAPLHIAAPRLIKDYFSFSRKVSGKERSLFARQLATMLEAGLTLSQSLRLIIRQQRKGKFRLVLEAVLRDIQEGYSFSSALAKHPQAFDAIFISVVRSGEATGKLEVVLSQVATTMEKDVKVKGKLRGAMVYPSFILFVMLVVVIIMLVVVIPNLVSIFAESGKQLPLSTLFLIFLSNFFRNDWLPLIVVILALYFGIRYFIRTPAGAEILSQFLLKVPIIKTLIQKSNMARLGRLLGMLLGSGLPLIEALKLVSASMSNLQYQKGVNHAISMIERGAPLSAPIIENPIFPVMVGQMISVGEQTGKMDDVMARMAGYYDEEVDTLTSTISSLIEPIVIVLLGIGVAWLLIAILLPIYQATTSV